MVQGKELPRVVHAPVIDTEDSPEKEKQPQSRGSSDGSNVHLSYASNRHGPSERVLSGQVLNDSLMAL
jgi:hypothetical protein